MKRSATLASLSRDHHQALVIAQRLRRATDESAGEARAAFLAYWEEHGEWHFRLEEKMLLPAYAAYGDAYDPLVLRVLGDHVEIRARAEAVVASASVLASALHELGERLASHVRREERELFPLIEQAMPAERLEALAQALERAGESGPAGESRRAP